MTLQSYLWGLRISAVVGLVAFGAVIFLTDPTEIGNTAFILFYLTFFLAISSISILILTALYRKMAHDMFTLGEVGMAVRQGILSGLLAVIIMIMQQVNVLLWWSALIVVGMIVLVEMYFLTK